MVLLLGTCAIFLLSSNSGFRVFCSKRLLYSYKENKIIFYSFNSKTYIELKEECSSVYIIWTIWQQISWMAQIHVLPFWGWN